ncbi:MAG: RluA family pseudouridine synthase [Bacteroidaceae bacterium]|nr:RluA family pseudouridine synthase [Bacteroidaceae bacterium]
MKRYNNKEIKGLRIVYEDRWLVVVDKAAGVLSVSLSPRSVSVKSMLDDYFERSHQRCRAHVVHRLDRDTSGLMVYAKSREVQQRFEADWKGLVYDRRYVALVRGRMPQQEGTIRSWLTIGKVFVKSSPVDNGGKLAVTHYRVLEERQGTSLVEARLDTGRKHQIRVHFASVGCPVVGDRKYNENENENRAQRLMLRAYRLCFVHPVTAKRLEFESSKVRE